MSTVDAEAELEKTSPCFTQSDACGSVVREAIELEAKILTRTF